MAPDILGEYHSYIQRVLCHMPHHHYIFLCRQYAVVCELILTETDDLKSALTKFDQKILRSQSEAWEKQRVSMSAAEKKGADDQQIDFKVRIKGEFLFVNFCGRLRYNRHVIGAPKSALRAFFWLMVKLVFCENHYKSYVMC